MSNFQEEATAECVLVGEGRADLAGIGIIVGFVGQATISLCLALWAFFFSNSGWLDGNHPRGSIESAIEQKRLECVSDILMVGNDIQMVIGTSYMISVFAQGTSIDTYHLHLVFDIVSFVGVSGAAALVCWTYCNVRLHRSAAPKDLSVHLLSRHFTILRSAHFTPRHRGAYLFATLYLALTILLCVSLDNWAPDREPGRCYFAHLVTTPTAGHPSADKIYVAMTASWMILVMLAAAFSGARWRHSILILAFLQFPVHLYMTLALRSANQGKLEGDAYENYWDFGQTTAVVLFAMALRELLDKGFEFYFFERDLQKRGALPKTTRRERIDGENSHELMGISGMEEGTGYYGASGVTDEERLGERSPLAMPAVKTTSSGREGERRETCL
ncbi:uncharacterized protein Triagg1_7353 [Trichoderma aggressivum f. europaeum]|uniref:Uncharacterized protein n=1 Tax=Trichoderma aggressivum f. europaeum TaxID=173218 RepID=A0AAE1IBS9_9HYPO|nr:hypothetical protein Triagg1_7353 [Trichoderma aggressivum f. europaeum]